MTFAFWTSISFQQLKKEKSLFAYPKLVLLRNKKHVEGTKHSLKTEFLQCLYSNLKLIK